MLGARRVVPILVAAVLSLPWLTVTAAPLASAAPEVPAAPTPGGGGSIAGTVTSESGEPLGAVEVVAFGYYGEGTAVTGDDGTYQIDGLSPGDYVVWFDGAPADHVGEYYDDVSVWWLGQNVAVASGAVVSGIDASLRPFGSITGTVTGSTGEPLADVFVCAEGLDPPDDYSCGASGPDGRYVIEGLTAGAYRVHFDGWAAGHASEYFDGAKVWTAAAPVVAVDGEVTAGIDAQLALGGAIAGTVIDSSGAPIEGVEVVAFGYHGEGSTITGADGTYVVGGLFPGDHVVFFDGDPVGYVSEYYDDVPVWWAGENVGVQAGSVVTNIDATLTRLGSISGTVTSSTGGPLADVYVCAEPDSPPWDYECAVSAEDGTYTILGLEPGQYRVWFDGWDSGHLSEYFDDAQGWDSAALVAVALEEDTPGVDAELANGGLISGAVTDESGAPLSGVWVYASGYFGDGYASTGPDGTYEIRGLRSGDYLVWFDGGSVGYLDEYYDDAALWSRARPVNVTQDATTTGIDASLARPGSISGVVTAADGAVAGPVYVCAQQVPPSADVTCTTSDIDGSYQLDGLRPGDYLVHFDGGFAGYGSEYYDDATVFSAATLVTVGSGEHRTGIDAELARSGGSISGRVTDTSGAPIPGVQVVAFGYYGEGSATTRGDGTYSVVGLPPGDYVVWFDGEVAGFVGEYYDDAPEWWLGENVRVETDAAVTGIDASLSSQGVISGTVTSSAGGPLSQVYVCAEQFAPPWDTACAVSADDGVYTIIGLEPGDYRVQFNGWNVGHISEYYDDVLQWEAATRVPGLPGIETTGIDAVLSAGGSIAGTVRDLSGAPIAGVEVSASGYYAAGSATTRDDGTYVITGLGPGDHIVRFDGGNVGYESEYYDDVLHWLFATSVLVEGEATTFGIDADLRRGGSIAGTVTDRAGPVAWTQVCAEGLDPPVDYRCDVTGSDGSYVVTGLAPGRYRVSFNAWVTDHLFEYFDDVSSWEDATVLVVESEAEISGVDAELSTGGEITGVVTDIDGAPLEEVFVCAEGLSAPHHHRCASTATDGTYTITGLLSGDYKVTFDPWPTGRLFEYYDDARWDDFTPVSVVAGEETTGIDAELALPGGISGVVTGPSGPVEGVEVSVFGRSDRWVGSAWATTGADGSFTISGLRPDDYEVRFVPHWELGLSTQWYDGSASRAGATVTVTSGEVTNDVNAVLAGAGAILGVVRDPGGAEVGGVVVQAYSPTDTWVAARSVTTDAGGVYVIDGLKPDSYKLRFVPPAGSGLAEQWYSGTHLRGAATIVEVLAGGVVNAWAELEGAGNVSGVVHGPGGVPVAGARVQAYAPGDVWVGSFFATTAADGSYVLAGVREGSYQIRVVPPAGAGLAVRWYDGAQVRSAAAPVGVTAGASITGIDVQLE